MAGEKVPDLRFFLASTSRIERVSTCREFLRNFWPGISVLVNWRIGADRAERIAR
jgi:hypothetical protein